jgi:hypothetical protein
MLRLASCRYPLRSRLASRPAHKHHSHPLYSAQSHLNFPSGNLRHVGRPFTRPLLLLPLTAFLATALFTSGSRPAMAQVGIGQTETRSYAPGRIPIAILDFEVAPGVDPVLGRKAADAVAVEMGRSGEYEPVPRQRMEEVLSTIAGLRPPYTPLTQIHLAEALGVNQVVTGEVVSAVVAVPTTAPYITNRRGARVQINARQLAAISGDLTIGAQVAEVATSEPSDVNVEVDGDVLIDEALNKAAYDAVRTIRQTRFAEGTIMNTTVDFVEIDKGFRNGVRPGQRFTVLRDVLNRSRTAVERIKVGEITIRRVEDDQSQGILSAGGVLGVRAGDKVRRIFVPGAFEVLPPSGTLTSPRPSYQHDVTPYQGSQARGAVTSEDRPGRNSGNARSDEMQPSNTADTGRSMGQNNQDNSEYYLTADGRLKRRESPQE